MKKIIILLLVVFLINFPAKGADETLIIFDASVSMLEPFEGIPKYKSAIKQTKEVLKTIPASEKIGLRTIGVSVDSAILTFLQNPNELCKATSLEVPINTQTQRSINSALDNIFPIGTTPLEYTLATAVNYDFSNNYYTKKRIILITDGADSCNGDPCKYIRELRNTRKDITVDIIAIGINAEDFAQLNCISKYSSGTLYNVKDIKDLNLAIKNSLAPKVFEKANFNSNNTKYKNYTLQFYN